MKTVLTSEHRRGPVVLVSRPIGFTFPLSYAYLAGHLRSVNEEVRVLFRQRQAEDTVRQIMAQKPLLVGFGSLYPELETIRELIALLDQAGRRFPVVIGGQMVSPIPDFAVRITGADYGVIGEGELILESLVKALRDGKDGAHLPGIVARDGDMVINNGSGPCIEDLAELPPVPYDLFPLDQWLLVGRWYVENRPQMHWRFDDRVINVHGGRGCPYRCNFCYHHSRPRYRPIDLMLGEAREAIERFGGNMLYFSDDLVLATPQRARQLVEALDDRGWRYPYSISARFDVLNRMDDATLEGLQRTGCRIMGLGLESGSDRILEIIGKRCNAEQIRTQLSRLAKLGILPTTCIMVGQESETLEDVELSMQLMCDSVRENPNIQYAFSLVTPFPGSQLHESIFARGLLQDEQEFYDLYFGQMKSTGEWCQVVNLSAMSDDQVTASWRRLQQSYETLKAELSPDTTRLDRLHTLLGRGNHILGNRLLPRVPANALKRVFQRAYRGVYEPAQRRIERARLRQYGLR